MLLCRACAAVEPELIGTRSSTPSGVVATNGSLPWGGNLLGPAGQRRQAEMLAQRAALVLGAEHTAFLQQRDHRGGELVQAAGRDVRHQDETVADVGLHPVVQRRGNRG